MDDFGISVIVGSLGVFFVTHLNAEQRWRNVSWR